MSEEQQEADDDIIHEREPTLWSATSDRGSNVKKGVKRLLQDDLELPCDQQSCVGHLLKSDIDEVLTKGETGGGSRTFFRDSSFVLSLSSALKAKSEHRDMLQDLSTADAAHY